MTPPTKKKKKTYDVMIFWHINYTDNMQRQHNFWIDWEWNKIGFFVCLFFCFVLLFITIMIIIHGIYKS